MDVLVLCAYEFYSILTGRHVPKIRKAIRALIEPLGPIDGADAYHHHYYNILQLDGRNYRRIRNSSASSSSIQ
jgi:hypothetical protein